MRQRALSLLLCVCAPACSAVVTASPSPPPSQTPDAAVISDASAVAPPTAFGGCVEGEAGAPMLTMIHAATAQRVLPDGSTRPLYQFATGASVEARVQTRDGWTLLHVSLGAAPQWEHRIALLTPAGALAWEEVIAVQQSNNPYRRSPSPSEILLGAQGRVALSLVGWPTDRAQTITRFITPAGVRAEILDRTPLAPPDASDRVLLRGNSADGTDTAWWTPATQTVTPLTREGEVSSVAFAMGESLVRYVTRPDGIFLARELHGREERVRLDFVTDVNQLQVSGREPDAWLLLSARDELPEHTLHRLNLRTMALDTLAVTPPAGRTLTTYSHFSIDRDGALLGAFRDAEWGSFYRSPDGQRWEPLGRPTSGALATLLGDREGGSYVIVGTNARYGGDEWPETVRDEPLGLRGNSLQITRPADGVNLSVREENPDALEPADVTLSPTGRCAAWVSYVGMRHVLNILDVNTATTRRVEFPAGSGGGLSSFAWQR